MTIHSSVRSRACTTSSSSYIRATVEKSIHKHRVVIFGRKTHFWFCNKIQLLLEDTPGTPFLAHEIKVYHLEDFPAKQEIEGCLRVLAGESLERKKLHLESKHHPSEQRQPQSPKHSPTRRRPAIGVSLTTDSTSNTTTIIDAIPCYVFVSGVFLSYKEIQDLFVKLAPKDMRTKSFVNYLKKHEYHGKRLIELPLQQAAQVQHGKYHSSGHRSHDYHHHHHSPPRAPKTRSSSTSPTYSKKMITHGQHRRTTSLDDTKTSTPKMGNHQHHKQYERTPPNPNSQQQPQPSHPHQHPYHRVHNTPPSLDKVMEE